MNGWLGGGVCHGNNPLERKDEDGHRRDMLCFHCVFCCPSSAPWALLFFCVVSAVLSYPQPDEEYNGWNLKHYHALFQLCEWSWCAVFVHNVCSLCYPGLLLNAYMGLWEILRRATQRPFSGFRKGISFKLQAGGRTKVWLGKWHPWYQHTQRVSTFALNDGHLVSGYNDGSVLFQHQVSWRFFQFMWWYWHRSSEHVGISRLPPTRRD